MALTRKYLKSIGLNEDQIEGVIEEHTSVTNDLKEKIKTLQTDAEKLPTVQKELDDLKAQGDGGYKEKYEAEAKAHREYKQQVEGEKKAALDEADVMAICKEAGIARESSLRLIVKDFDRSKIERGEDGKITNRAKLVEAVKTDYADFVGTPGKDGTPPVAPPTGSGSGMTREQILDIKDAKARQQAIADNMELFNRK